MNLKRRTSFLLMTVAVFFPLDTSAQDPENQHPAQTDTKFQNPMMFPQALPIILSDRSSAMASAHSVDTRLAVKQLMDPGALKDGPGTVKQLVALSQRDNWPLPARELAIYQFTRSLAALPKQAVGPVILDFLTLYQSQVLVIGDEHASDLQPLFNIRGAATGVQNRWLRLDSAIQAAEIINTRPSEFLAMFNQAQSSVVKSGYLDGLRQADISSIQEIASKASAQISEVPELSAVVAVAAQAGIQGDSVQRLLIAGQGPHMAPTMRDLAVQLSRQQLAKLLQFAIEKAPAENAALAIASWWPVLSSDPSARQLLFNSLADPELGSAAALALADRPNVQTIHELQQLAKGDSLSAKRAQMSLNINREVLVREQQQ